MTCIGVGLLFCLFSDLLDGAVARKLNQCSEFGSKFDSLSDQLVQISALIWVLMLMPEIFSENLLITIIAISLYASSLMVGLVKFKRIANLHLYLSKFGGLFLYVFLIHAFLFGEYNQFLFLVAGIFFILSSAETLYLQIISTDVNSNIGTVLYRYLEDDHPIRYWLSRIP